MTPLRPQESAFYTWIVVDSSSNEPSPPTPPVKPVKPVEPVEPVEPTDLSDEALLEESPRSDVPSTNASPVVRRRSRAGSPNQVRRRLEIGTLIYLPYLIASLVLFIPLLTRGFSTRLPAGADSVLDTWGFQWLPHALTTGANPFFTQIINYPHGVNLLANTTQLGLAFVEWPVTAAFGPIASFNLACLLAPSLSAAAMYLLARTVTRNRIVAWLAGLAYGFSAYEVNALSNFHLQLLFIPLPPLFFLALYDLLAGRRWRAVPLGLALGGLTIAQFFISTEILVVTIIGLAIAAVISIAITWRAQIGHWGRLITVGVVALGVATIALAYPAWFATLGPGSINGVETLSPQAYRADLLGPLLPSGHQLIAPAVAIKLSNHFATTPSENYSYLGIPLVLVLIASGVLLWRRRTVVVALATAVVSFLLSLGGAIAVSGTPRLSRDLTRAVGAWGPERLLAGLPLLKDVVPSRFALITVIAALVAFAALLDLISRRLKDHAGWARTLVVGGVAVLCILPLLPRLPFGELRRSVRYDAPPAGMAQLLEGRVPHGAPVTTFPYPWAGDMSPLLWQTGLAFRFAMPTGYFRVPVGRDRHVGFSGTYGYGEPTYVGEVLTSLEMPGRAMPLTPDVRAQFLAQLHAWHCHWLLASFSTHLANQQAFYLSVLLGRTPTASTGHLALFKVPSA